MVCLPTGAVVGASCVLFYQSGRRSRHPRVPSTGKASILSCEFLLFSRTNSRALGFFLQQISHWHEDRSDLAVNESVGADCPGEAPDRGGVGPPVPQEIDNSKPLLKLSVSGCLEHGVDVLSLLALLSGIFRISVSTAC